MTRSQSETIAETIIAAVAPLATRKDLEATRTDIAALRKETKDGFAEMREETKAGFTALKEQMATKSDLESLKEHMATKKDMESVKVWYLVTFLGLVGSLLAIDAI